jgi:hypothetical protein
MMQRSKKVAIKDLFKYMKDLIGYLNTQILDITDLTKGE